MRGVSVGVLPAGQLVHEVRREDGGLSAAVVAVVGVGWGWLGVVGDSTRRGEWSGRVCRSCVGSRDLPARLRAWVLVRLGWPGCD